MIGRACDGQFGQLADSLHKPTVRCYGIEIQALCGHSGRFGRFGQLFSHLRQEREVVEKGERGNCPNRPNCPTGPCSGAANGLIGESEQSCDRTGSDVRVRLASEVVRSDRRESRKRGSGQGPFRR